MGPWGLDSFIGLIRILTTTGEAMHGTHHVPSIPLTDKHIKGKAYMPIFVEYRLHSVCSSLAQLDCSVNQTFCLCYWQRGEIRIVK